MIDEDVVQVQAALRALTRQNRPTAFRSRLWRRFLHEWGPHTFAPIPGCIGLRCLFCEVVVPEWKMSR